MKHFFAFIFCFALFLVKGQQYSFAKYSLEEGLPQSQVTNITQGKNGLLWIGTLGGLSRFSGKEFVNYSVESGLVNNRISFLGFIHDTLWVGHEKGISVQSGKKFIPIRTPEIEGGVKVTDILLFHNKKIVATNGNGIFVLRNKKLTPIAPFFQDSLPNHKAFERVRDLLVVNNRLYLGTRLGVFYTEDLKHFSLLLETKYISISKLSLDKHKNLYFSTYGQGILQWNRVKKSIIPKLTNQNALLISKDFFIDHLGNVWAAVKNNGVVCIKENTQLVLNTKSGLPTDNVSCVFKDRENNIWIGTEGKGLLRFTGEAFVHYNKQDGLSGDLIMSIAQEKNKTLWFSSYTAGVSKMTKDTKINFYDADGVLANKTIWCSLVTKKGSIWLGTSAGICVASESGEIFYNVENTREMPGNKISALFQDSKGVIWIGGRKGLSFYHNNTFHRLKNTNFKIENVRSFTENEEKLYFVAQEGLFVIHPNKTIKKFKISNNQPTAYSVAVDFTGRIWVGTEEGLYYLEDKQLKNFNFSQENSSNFINFITPQKHFIWIGTNNGVFKLSALKSIDEIAVEQYGKQDGLVSLETNLNSGFIDKKGRFWFGTAGGLMCYDAKKDNKMSLIRPNILFKGLKVNFESVDVNSLYTKSKNRLAQQLNFPYSKKHLTFQFVGVSLSNPDQMKFSYKLEGFDEAWSPEMPASEITYSNLPAGDYTLLAKVKNENGFTSKAVRIPFTVNPPFYATWWFIVICVFAVVLMVFGFFIFRIKQIQRRQATERLIYTSRLRVLEQQSLNASMNRHFIFNALNSIQYFINTKNKLAANRYLSQFAKLIRQNLDSSTGENNTTSLEDEIERLKLYLSIESMRFPDKFEYDFEINPEIDVEKIRVPSMIFQPFIENSIIHGILPNKDIKGKIHFIVKKIENDCIEVEIEDNGVGYENSINQKLPSGDHQSQGMTITSSRIELLQKISGKEFKLIGPQDKKNTAGKSTGTTVKIIIALNSLEY